MATRVVNIDAAMRHTEIAATVLAAQVPLRHVALETVTAPLRRRSFLPCKNERFQGEQTYM